MQTGNFQNNAKYQQEDEIREKLVTMDQPK